MPTASDPMYDKVEVNFEHPSRGMHQCSQCVHFDPGGISGGHCQIVAGVVRATDWCDRFKRKVRR